MQSYRTEIKLRGILLYVYICVFVRGRAGHWPGNPQRQAGCHVCSCRCDRLSLTLRSLCTMSCWWIWLTLSRIWLMHWLKNRIINQSAAEKDHKDKWGGEIRLNIDFNILFKKSVSLYVPSFYLILPSRSSFPQVIWSNWIVCVRVLLRTWQPLVNALFICKRFFNISPFCQRGKKAIFLGEQNFWKYTIFKEYSAVDTDILQCILKPFMKLPNEKCYHINKSY